MDYVSTLIVEITRNFHYHNHEIDLCGAGFTLGLMTYYYLSTSLRTYLGKRKAMKYFNMATSAEMAEKVLDIARKKNTPLQNLNKGDIMGVAFVGIAHKLGIETRGKTREEIEREIKERF
jgi:hypothetical protein